MNFFSGILYNLKGLKFAFKSPKLLLLGLSRLIVVVLLMTILAGLIFYHHTTILNFLWARPDSGWFIWLWTLVSWLLSLVLMGFSGIFAYLIAQILFSVLIMDIMSRITESMVKAQVVESPKMPFYRQLIYLIRQEVPRAILPVMAVFLVMIFGWLTPLGPVLTVVSSVLAVLFLAWDNTDLIPARRQEPFRKRWALLMGNLMFHLGFGVLFLIPVLNILFLSFAPVGATLYYIDKQHAD